MKKVLVSLFCVSVSIWLAGCGVNGKKIAEADAKLKEYMAKGVPDTVLSPSMLMLISAQEGIRIKDSRIAKESYDSLKIYLANLDAFYAAKVNSSKILLDSFKTIFAAARPTLTGIQLAKLDKAVAKIDSLIGINWIFQAEAAAMNTDTLVSMLNIDEQKSAAVKDLVPGTWSCINDISSQEIKEIKAVETTIYEFGKDGSGKLIQTNKGQNDKFTKMDYSFTSTGTWELAGDTIYLRVSRFKCDRQIVDLLNLVDGKSKWEKTVHPTFDSTITSGAQDRWIAWEDLKEDFIKKK